MIKYAISEDYLSKDPFMLYKAKRVKKEVVFLSPEQLKKLKETEFKIARVQYIKDLKLIYKTTSRKVMESLQNIL